MTFGRIFTGLTVLALAGVATAQEPEAEPAAATAPGPVDAGSRRMSGTPEIRVVSFVDRDPSVSGDCASADARVGQCVEWVDFMPVAQMMQDGMAEPASVADSEGAESGAPTGMHEAFRNQADVYARIMEDVSYRWNSSESVEQAFMPYGVYRIPPAGDHWEAMGAGPGEPLYGLPHSSYYVDGAQFLPPKPAPDADSIYRYIRFNHEPGIPEPVPWAVLSGRFADRMIFDEEPRKLDLMDADPTSSAPFFDQMYPYRTARFFGAGDVGFGQEERSVTIPLSDFEVPPELRTTERLASEMTDGVGTDPDLMLTEAQTRALEQHIARTRVRRAAFSELLFTDHDDPEQAREIAGHEYESFYRDIGAQVVKFGRENYTPTHLRVLASLFAMQSPPDWNESFVSTSRMEMENTGPLLISEIDDESDEAGESSISEDPPESPAVDDDYYYYDDEAPESSDVDVDSLYDDLGNQAGIDTHINYSALPPKLVAAHLDYLTTTRGLQPMDEGFAEWMHTEYRRPADRRSMLKDRARAMPPEDGETVVQWISRYAVRYAKGANERAVEEGMNRIALERVIAQQAASDIAQADLMETALLLDHVRYSTVDRFVSGLPPEEWTSPMDQEALAEEQWIEVLAAHDYFPMPLDEADDDAQRNAWYDPMSVCTTRRDFRAAAEEPVFGSVDLDLLIVADDGQDLSDPYAALWQARERVPFVWVDDPRESAQPPVMTRMVGLPDGQAIYRVRWKVWTGWHLFWGVEDVGSVQWKGQVPESAAAGQLVWMRRHYDWLREWAGTPVVAEEAQRVALRTGAVCSDLALVDPMLVPTLVRAALLDDNFRPTVPYTDGMDTAQVRSDDVGLGARLAGNRNVDSRATVGDSAEVGTAIAEENEFEERPLLNPNPPENIADIREWVLPRIGALSEDPLSDPTMLVVFDTYESSKKARTHEVQPRVPYFRQDRKFDGEHIITAGWALAIPPGEVAQPVMLSPDWVDTNSVNAEGANPRWRQRRTLHFTMAFDALFRPHHLSRSRCSDDQGTLNASTGPCGLPGVDPKDSYQDTLASGIGGQYTLLQTLWLGSNRRVAVEYGLGAGVMNLFKPINLGNRDANQQSIVNSRWRLYGGPVVGLRGGSNPRKLYRRNGRGALWGAKDRDESTRQGRTEYGLRVGVQFGSLNTGLFGEVLGDAWWARSITPGRAKNRMFTAYHPSFLIGPFVGGRYARDMSVGTDGTPRSLGHTQSFDVGIRIQARVFNYGGADPTAGVR